MQCRQKRVGEPYAPPLPAQPGGRRDRICFRGCDRDPHSSPVIRFIVFLMSGDVWRALTGVALISFLVGLALAAVLGFLERGQSPEALDEARPRRKGWGWVLVWAFLLAPSLLGRGPSRLRSFDGQCSLVKRPNQRNTRGSEFQLDRRATRLGGPAQGAREVKGPNRPATAAPGNRRAARRSTSPPRRLRPPAARPRRSHR